MKTVLCRRILTAVLVAMATVISISSCGKKSAADEMEAAIKETRKQLPSRVDDDLTWVDVSYDRSANEIVFDYASDQYYSFTPEMVQMIHESMAGLILPAFEGDGQDVVDLLRELRPNVRYIFRWASNGQVLIDDTCTADEYL